MVVHTIIQSTWEVEVGRSWYRLALAKVRPYLKNKLEQKRLAEWLK
jgi:hypothetical protein